MKGLDAKIAEMLQDVPRRLIQRMIKKKLDGQNIKDESLVQALTDHILLRSQEPFQWETGDDDIVIKFTDQDSTDLLDDLNTFTNITLPKAITKAVTSTSSSIVKRLERDWPQVKLTDRHDMQSFKDRLDLRWASALDPLRMMLLASRDLGEAFALKLSRSKAKKGIAKRQAIALLHLRACQNTTEIITLLENGLPDGAYARWRTLYEISVVCFLIERFGDEIAQRYLDHDVVSERESIINQLEHEGKSYDPKRLTPYIKSLEASYQDAITKYGTPFKSPYGWAAYHLDLKAPRFTDLEKAVDWPSLPPDYKWSSYKVHAGVAGTTWTLASLRGEQFLHAGVTNAGLHVPAVNTAFSILHISSCIIGSKSDLETQVHMKTLLLLRDKVLVNCRKVVRKLEKDHIQNYGIL